MQIRLVLDSKTWQVRFPVAGALDGWSPWEAIPRGEALNLIERGFSFETI